MNIQFGNNKNNTDRVKKIYNQGDIITARPKTSKQPYKILSVKESARQASGAISKLKSPIKNNIYTLNNIYTIKKSFSCVGSSIKGKKINEIKLKKNFNKSFYDNNCLLSAKRKTDYIGEDKTNKFFSINNENSDKAFNKNRKLIIRRGFSSTKCINKKKVSSYSMSKYIEKYIDKDYLNNSKTNKNNNNINNKNDLYKINLDENNNQVIHFLSEVINTEMMNINCIYQTTNGIAKNNVPKNKSNTRNLIIQNYCNNYLNKISLSNEMRPVIIQQKINFMKENEKKIKNNFFLKNKKIVESGKKLKKNKSYKITTVKYKNEKEDYIKKAISIETDKQISKRRHFETDKKEKEKKYIIINDKIKIMEKNKEEFAEYYKLITTENNKSKNLENNTENYKEKNIENINEAKNLDNNYNTIKIIENNKENNIVKNIEKYNKAKNVEKNNKEKREINIEKNKAKSEDNNKVKIVDKNIEKKAENLKRHNNILLKIKNSNKKKFNFSKDLNKPQKKKFFNNQVTDIDNKCFNDFKNEKLIYFCKSNNFRGIKQRKNDDIYNYLILPKESEKNNDVINNEYVEFKSNKQ